MEWAANRRQARMALDTIQMMIAAGAATAMANDKGNLAERQKKAMIESLKVKEPGT